MGAFQVHEEKVCFTACRTVPGKSESSAAGHNSSTTLYTGTW
jgi:hypothetical protein